MKPFVKNSKTQIISPAEFRMPGEGDVDEIMRLQSELSEEDKKLYLEGAREDFERLTQRGELAGFFTEGRLIALCALLPPGAGEGLDADLQLPCEPPRTAELERYFVSPLYRENGLGAELV
ncbi:MAG: GNAT family N-acetyltransferase, partial [Oscillospiraceae bacterium]|nr:GNAT family N-acetyltransferase [Oscillospiraceae bacterium]